MLQAQCRKRGVWRSSPKPEDQQWKMDLDSEAPSDLYRKLIGLKLFYIEICVTLWQTLVHIDGCFFCLCTGVPFCWRHTHTPKRDISHRNQLMSQKDTSECYTPLEMLENGMDAKSMGSRMVQTSSQGSMQFSLHWNSFGISTLNSPFAYIAAESVKSYTTIPFLYMRIYTAMWHPWGSVHTTFNFIEQIALLKQHPVCIFDR